MKNRERYFKGVTNNFKYSLILILIAIIYLRLYFIFFLGAERVVTEQIVLFLAIFIMFFVWFIENNDRKKLLKLNRNLNDVNSKLLTDHLNTVKTLVSTLEAKDPYTSGHCERVTKYALQIVDVMNLNSGLKNRVKNAASIHDIGKLAIEDRILNKKDKLEDNEWEVIKKHPNNAMNILSVLDFLGKEKQIILHHHERFDGNGYPDGLKDGEIPLGARIMAVADSFDAMNSARAYRDPLPKHVILGELKKGKGSQFDPEVVDAFLNILKENDSYFLNLSS